MRFTDDARRARLARRHALRPEYRLEGPLEVARAMVALHATEAATVHLAVAARLAHPRVDAVEDALYEQRSIVKQVAMRSTLFAFPRELLPAAWGSASARVAEQQLGRLVREVELHGLSADGAAWVERAGLPSWSDWRTARRCRRRVCARRCPRSTATPPQSRAAPAGNWPMCRSRRGCSPCCPRNA